MRAPGPPPKENDLPKHVVAVVRDEDVPEILIKV